jgi:peptide-methionine (S)-S-oxide reductase
MERRRLAGFLRGTINAGGMPALPGRVCHNIGMRSKIWLALSGIVVSLAVFALQAMAVPGTGGKMTGNEGHLQHAYFAAGCFWKVQYVFTEVPGVIKVRAGYMGGKTKNPSYEDVCTDQTGHAETVSVAFDPTKVSYHKLLEVFFGMHDPTTKDRQGPDIGNQYRSAIFCSTAEQQKAATEYKNKLEHEHKFRSAITTLIEPAGIFYDAEEYHQDYFVKHGQVCH